MKRTLLTVLCFVGIAGAACGQEVALKTNLLYDVGALTPNLGVEFGVAKRMTIDVSGGYNGDWKWSNGEGKKAENLFIQPEFRYWLCQKFNGHFFGVHAIYSKYDVGGYEIPLLFDKQYRYDGSAIGGGVSWGYHLICSTHWGMEFTLGAGIAMMRYDKYDRSNAAAKIGTYNKTYFGPTKAGITLVYIIK